MDYVTQLREEFSATHKEATDLISAAAKESRELTGEEKAANEKRFSRLEAIKSQIDETTRFAKMALDAGEVILPKQPAGKDEYEASEGRKQFAAAKSLDLDAIRDGINQYARTGETRQLFTVSTSTGSGAFLPKQVLPASSVRRLANAYRAVLDAYGYRPIETDSLAAFSLPVADDTANVGVAQSQTATSGTELDPTDASLSISPTLYGSKQFWYSNTMVMAQSFDVMGYTLPMAQKRIDKVQESAWTTTLKTATNVTTTASTSGITYAELLTWEHALPAAYRSDAAFIVSDSLYKVLRGLVDSQGRPILDQDPTNVFAGKIHGKPVVVCDYLDAVAAIAISGAFVSADALKIVDVNNARIVRYSNVPQKPDQIGFEVFVNGDFNFVNKGVALLQQHA